MSSRCGEFAGGSLSLYGGLAGAETTEQPPRRAKRPAPIVGAFEGFRLLSPVFCRQLSYRGDRFKLAKTKGSQALCNRVTTAVPIPDRASLAPIPDVCHTKHTYVEIDSSPATWTEALC